MDGYLHPSLPADEEMLRRGRLQIRFGILGGFMAIVYSGLFLLLGHYWGGIILGASGFAIAQVPWIVRKTGNLSLTGHLYGGALMLGVTSLCVIDGGRESIMFAWLAAVPVSALLLSKLSEAIWWCAVCLATATVFVCLDLKGIQFIHTSELNQNPALSSVSYLGLILFLTFLALLFEKGRLEASLRFQRASKKLKEANQQLTDLNHQKNEFLNIAAHDLKNPLSIICGYADLLREIDEPTPEEIHVQAGEILQSGNHMLDIIRNILDVRAIEDGQRNLSREQCHISQIVEDVVSGYQKFAFRKQIQIFNEISSDSPDAWSDPGATRQILENLISNAVKYTPHGGLVKVSATSSENEISISVSDTGPGLSETDQKKLWGKFTRLTPRPTGKEHSTGLGLWIVRRLATDMDGNTFCVSSEGEGSTFSIRLPLWTSSSTTMRKQDDSGKTTFDRLLAEVESKSGTEVALPG